MYPITLGANIGTTVTGLLAALASASTDSLQVALSHLFFNLTGILIWYPIPFMRRIPMTLAKNLGKATKLWRAFPLVYIAVAFFGIPLLLLGISVMCANPKIGVKAFGAVLATATIIAFLYWAYWWWYKGGKGKCVVCVKKRQRTRDMMVVLPDTLDQLTDDVDRLKDFTGLPDKEDEDEEKQGLLDKEEGDLGNSESTDHELDTSGEGESSPKGNSIISSIKSSLNRSMQA